MAFLNGIGDCFPSTDCVLSRTGRLGVSLFAAALLLAAALVPAVQAQHPTAVTSIVNTNADTTLEVNHNGSLLVPGTYSPASPNDSIPTEGAGTRLMWYPEKAAFRAGRVGRFAPNETNWDASNVGDYSVAFGVDTEASGDDATAMGRLTTASGDKATAMGLRTEASGDQATAMGLSTVAATNGSLSIGLYNSANISSDGTLFVVGNGLASGRSDALVLSDNGSGGGDLTVNGDVTADNFNSSSDRRLKTDIEPIENGTLQKLGSLRPVRYEFKNQRPGPSGEQLGLIAQDVQTEFPSLVREGSDGMLSLAYPKLSAVLLKGLQEQQATIEAQQARIDSLTRRVDRLVDVEQEVADLKAENEEIQAENEEIKERLAALDTKRSSSTVAGLAGSSAGLLLVFLLGGLFGAALLLQRRS